MKCPAFWPYRTGHFPFILYYILLIAMSNVLWCLLKNVAHAEQPNLASHWLQQVLSSLEMIFTLYFYCVCTYYKLRRIGSSQWRRNIFLWWGRGKLIFYRKKFERQNFYLVIFQKKLIIVFPRGSTDTTVNRCTIPYSRHQIV